LAVSIGLWNFTTIFVKSGPVFLPSFTGNNSRRIEIAFAVVDGDCRRLDWLFLLCFGTFRQNNSLEDQYPLILDIQEM
jgi:hypothetical protein